VIRLPARSSALIALLYSLLPAPCRAQDAALSTLLEQHRLDPSNADLCQQIGIAYTRQENFGEAEKFYREAIHLNPRFWAAHKNLGTVLWFEGRKEESEREFLAVTNVLPADPVPHLYLGLAAYALRDFPRARLQFEKAGTLASENPEVLPAVLESYLATKDMSFPEKVMEKLTRVEEDPALVTRVGGLFSQYGHAEQAYRAFSRAIEIAPNSEDAYVAFAEFASAHGNDDYALQVVARGLEHVPQSPPLLFEQGILSALKGDRTHAENSFVQANRLKPAWNLPLLALGVTQLESGDAVQAAAIFQKACAADPRDSRAQYLYATALSRESGANPAQARATAIAALRQAIQINPDDARSHTLLGQLYLQTGKADSAALEWQAALKIDPENSTSLYQLGLLYRKQGNAAEAERLLQRFRRVRAKAHSNEENLVQILRIEPNR